MILSVIYLPVFAHPGLTSPRLDLALVFGIHRERFQYSVYAAANVRYVDYD